MKISRNQLRQIIREEIQRVHEEDTIEESTFVAAYNGSRGTFAHEFKARDIKDALQRFIDMYRIPSREADKIKIRKTSKGLFGLF